MQKDPVCGMAVSEEKAERIEFRGKTYYFCAAGCKKRFESDPDYYLKEEKPDWVRGE